MREKIFSRSFQEQPILGPAESIKTRSQRLGLKIEDLRLPRYAILSLNVRATDLLISETHAKQVPWVYAARPLYIGSVGEHRVCVIWAAPGAPLAAMVSEDLIACGVTDIIGVGSLGAIRTSVAIGDLVIPSKAERDEGTSYHYLPGSAKALPTKEYVKILANSCRDLTYNYHIGPVWTTDAPYRETQSKLDYFSRKGVLGVEMESSAIFSVGIYRHIRTATILAAMSNLRIPGRDLGVYPMGPSQTLRSATKASIETIKKISEI